MSIPARSAPASPDRLWLHEADDGPPRTSRLGMTMLTVAFDAVTTAAMLFIIAAGLLIVFGVMKIINFAHAAFLTVGAYAALVGVQLNLPWVLILPLAFISGAICGGITEIVIVRRLYKRPLDAILATWGLGIVLGQLITL